jgi:hypothetical protein
MNMGNLYTKTIKATQSIGPMSVDTGDANRRNASGHHCPGIGKGRFLGDETTAVPLTGRLPLNQAPQLLRHACVPTAYEHSRAIYAPRPSNHT